MEEKQLSIAPADADIITEEFFNTDGLPRWIIGLQYKNLLCRIIYYILLILFLR